MVAPAPHRLEDSAQALGLTDVVADYVRVPHSGDSSNCAQISSMCIEDAISDESTDFVAGGHYGSFSFYVRVAPSLRSAQEFPLWKQSVSIFDPLESRKRKERINAGPSFNSPKSPIPDGWDLATRLAPRRRMAWLPKPDNQIQNRGDALRHGTNARTSPHRLGSRRPVVRSKEPSGLRRQGHREARL